MDSEKEHSTSTIYGYLVVGCATVATMLWDFIKYKGLEEEFKEWINKSKKRRDLAGTIKRIAKVLN